MTSLAVRRPEGLRSWWGLTVLAGAGCVLVLLWQGVRHHDVESLALAGVILVGMALTRTRFVTAATVLLGLVFLDTLVFLLPAANANANARAGVDAMFVPGSVTAMALAGLIGAVMAVRTRRAPDAGHGTALATGVIVALFVGAGLSLTWLMTPAPPAEVAEGALLVESRSVAFEPAELTAPAGGITVALRNRDLFWHTFTVPDLGVNVAVPVGGLGTKTFTAEPGTYRFMCAIPGHEQAGMRGTLIVR